MKTVNKKRICSKQSFVVNIFILSQNVNSHSQLEFNQ